MKKHFVSITILFTILLLPGTICLGQKVVRFNPDSLKRISKLQFDELVDASVILLQKNELSNISDSEHVNIMMCLNTILMAGDINFKKRFVSGRYKQLQQVSEEKKYTTEIIKVYPKWIPNRGMGFYFPKLQMKLYGTPRLYAWFQVEK